MAKLENQEDFDTLIPELRDWNEDDDVSPEDWIAMVGRFDLAIGYSLLFWPRFVEFEGYVLRRGFAVDALRSFETQGSGDRKSVEWVMNHIHPCDIHANVSEVSEQQLRYLGRVMARIHEVKLREDFPQRRFIVEFNDEPGLQPADYQFSFWQID